MNSIKVSVIIPMYNAERYIVHAVNCLLSQTLKDIEILVMDDCSTDGGAQLVREAFGSSDNVFYHRMERNGGPAKARNRGIGLARGEYVAFLDSDDGMMPDALEKLYAAAVRFDADVVQSAGVYIPVMCPAPDDIMATPKEFLARMVKDVSTSSPELLEHDCPERLCRVMDGSLWGNVWGKLFRTRFLTENGIYMPDLKMSEDVIMCLRCAVLAERYVVTPYFGVIYRMIGDSLSKGKKSPAFMCRILEATFGGDRVVKEFMRTDRFFIENGDWGDRITGWMDKAMEDFYIRPCYQEVGREALQNDPAVAEVFRRHFGDLAGYVEYQFYQNHDQLPEVIDYFDNAVAYRWLKKQLETAAPSQADDPDGY